MGNGWPMAHDGNGWPMAHDGNGSPMAHDATKLHVQTNTKPEAIGAWPEWQ